MIDWTKPLRLRGNPHWEVAETIQIDNGRGGYKQGPELPYYLIRLRNKATKAEELTVVNRQGKPLHWSETVKNTDIWLENVPEEKWVVVLTSQIEFSTREAAEDSCLSMHHFKRTYEKRT